MKSLIQPIYNDSFMKNSYDFMNGSLNHSSDLFKTLIKWGTKQVEWVIESFTQPLCSFKDTDSFRNDFVAWIGKNSFGREKLQIFCL